MWTICHRNKSFKWREVTKIENNVCTKSFMCLSNLKLFWVFSHFCMAWRHNKMFYTCCLNPRNGYKQPQCCTHFCILFSSNMNLLRDHLMLTSCYCKRNVYIAVLLLPIFIPHDSLKLTFARNSWNPAVTISKPNNLTSWLAILVDIIFILF